MSRTDRPPTGIPAPPRSRGSEQPREPLRGSESRESTSEPEALLEPLLDAGDVAAAFKVSKRTIYELAAAGAIPSVRIGRAVRFRVRDVRALIEGRA